MHKLDILSYIFLYLIFFFMRLSDAKQLESKSIIRFQSKHLSVSHTFMPFKPFIKFVEVLYSTFEAHRC